MNLHIRVKYLKGLDDATIKRAVSYRNEDQFVDMHADKFTLVQLDAIYDRALKDSKDGKESGARGLCQKITAYKNVRSNPSGQKIGKLEPFATALRAHIEPSPNKWLFADGS